jgi:hypothetical protein
VERDRRGRRAARSRARPRVALPGHWVRQLSAIPTIAPADENDPTWYPLQHHFGLSAFGANVYEASRAGIELVGQHDESESGQEELYIVVAGAARFTLDGGTVDAPAVTVVAITDPGVLRAATALEAGTTVMAVGGPAAERFESSWRPDHFEGVPRAGG